MKDTTKSAAKVSLEAVKTEFVSGLKEFYKVKDRVKAAFDKAVPLIIGESKSTKSKKLLRETLIKWGVDAGLVKGTVANTVSALMLANGLKMRARSKTKPSDEVVAAVQELMEFIGESFDSDELDIAAVLRLALEKLSDDKEETAVKEETAKEEKAA